MAFIGLRYAIAAPIESEVEGSPVTYGKGFVIGKAMRADINWQRSDNVLHADDMAAESDNGILGGTIELGVDDVEDETRADLLGDLAKDGEYEETDLPSPKVGTGYVRERKKNGKKYYTALWLYKVQYAENSESAETRGDNTNWQTPTLTGRIMPVRNDDTGANKFRLRKRFETYAAAKAWIDAKGNISSTPATPTT